MTGYTHVPDGPEVSGPDLDDLGLVECDDCDHAHEPGKPCVCQACDGDGALGVWDGRSWQREPCGECGGFGRLP